MIIKKIKNLTTQDILAEDIYKSKHVEHTSKEIPLISKGTLLTEQFINKLNSLFEPDYEVMIISKKFNDNRIEEKTSVIGKSKIFLTKDEALNIFRNYIFQMPFYKFTREKLLFSFEKIGEAMKSFIDTYKIDDDIILQVAQMLTQLIIENNELFDPLFIYIIEMEDWDEITFNHSFDVAVLALTFASSLSRDPKELTSIFISGLIHDIGKYIYSMFNINEMDFIIKKEGSLTDEEFNKMKSHVDVKDFLKNHFNSFTGRYKDNIVYGAIDHHEKFDGNGYLFGKKGMAISFAGRLIAICDVYDAMMRERRYKSAMKPNLVMSFLAKLARKGQFDPNLFRKFYNTLGKFPIGSVLTTNLGLGVVIGQTADPEKPVIFLPDKGEVNSNKNANIKIIEE